jgi:hypothetical protein
MSFLSILDKKERQPSNTSPKVQAPLSLHPLKGVMDRGTPFRFTVPRKGTTLGLGTTSGYGGQRGLFSSPRRGRAENKDLTEKIHIFIKLIL